LLFGTVNGMYVECCVCVNEGREGGMYYILRFPPLCGPHHEQNNTTQNQNQRHLRLTHV
jgi:hypothetical protein